MSEKIYIIGHKSPDLDSVIAAITYANLKNKIEDSDIYIPAVAGSLNQVTKFVLNKFGFQEPEFLENAEDKKIILVDHNEFSQIVDGGEKAKIIEVLDHHKVNFSYSEPICFQVCPWGSTTSMVYRKYVLNGIKVDEKLAGLMLSAILDDTVITKSPTCTAKDKEFIDELSKLANILNWQEYGLEMFKEKSSLKNFSSEDIIKLDFKDFNFRSGKFGFGQVETVDLNEFTNRENDLLKKMEELKESGNYHTVGLFITDIIKEGSQVLILTDNKELCEKSLGEKIANNKTYVSGLVSRKKQVVPNFTENFDK